jgi:hypothetical protein
VSICSGTDAAAADPAAAAAEAAEAAVSGFEAHSFDAYGAAVGSIRKKDKRARVETERTDLIYFMSECMVGSL